MTDVTIPAGLWDESQEGVLATWYYSDGETVQSGQVIAEVLTEKVAHDIEAPASGSIELMVKEEQPISVGQTIARIRA